MRVLGCGVRVLARVGAVRVLARVGVVLVRVLVVVPLVGGVPVPVVQVVDVVAVQDRLVPAPGPVLVGMALGVAVARGREVDSPRNLSKAVLGN